jgi:hypothetical protein
MLKTTKYEFGKPEQNDFYDINVHNNNMDEIERALTEFDDSGKAEGITSFTDMFTKLATGNKLAVTLRNLKAGLQFCLHVGSIVNNCVTDNARLPLSAAQGKVLMDAVTKLNSDKLTKGSLFTVILPMSYNVPGGSTVDVNVSCDRAGYVALGIIGVSGLVANCEARQFHINDNNVSISIYNRATSAQSGSGTVRVLYRAE